MLFVYIWVYKLPINHLKSIYWSCVPFKSCQKVSEYENCQALLLLITIIIIIIVGVDGCVLIKCVCIEGWSEGELYWARKDGILNADNIARELENAQIREISALEIGIEEGMQMGVQMGMRIEEEMGMRIEKEIFLK